MSKKLSGICILGILLFGCATSPLGRKQLILVSDSQMNSMGAQAFQEMRVKEPIEHQSHINQYVQCIVRPLVLKAKGQTPVENWDVVVFSKDEANAFALPGGKIGVYTGLFKTAKTDAQLAAVIGHEIGHVIARHGAERVSQQASTQIGLAALGAITPDNPKKDLLVGLLGVGVQVGILLPFSRTQESEADMIGLKLMARAGFDPRQSVELWKNMLENSRGKVPPQILSTHPASENRIHALEGKMDEVLPIYDQAKREGNLPSCHL